MFRNKNSNSSRGHRMVDLVLNPLTPSTNSSTDINMDLNNPEETHCNNNVCPSVLPTVLPISPNPPSTSQHLESDQEVFAYDSDDSVKDPLWGPISEEENIVIPASDSEDDVLSTINDPNPVNSVVNHVTPEVMRPGTYSRRETT